jgi:predicted nucleotidyltransferase component of viral defense system
MGSAAALNLSPERRLHVEIMRAIARELHDLPMVLKGGTALLLCYGLDRFSEDLDFD